LGTKVTKYWPHEESGGVNPSSPWWEGVWPRSGAGGCNGRVPGSVPQQITANGSVRSIAQTDELINCPERKAEDAGQMPGPGAPRDKQLRLRRFSASPSNTFSGSDGIP